MFFIEELSLEEARIVLSDLKRSYSYYYEISFEMLIGKVEIFNDCITKTIIKNNGTEKEWKNSLGDYTFIEENLTILRKELNIFKAITNDLNISEEDTQYLNNNKIIFEDLRDFLSKKNKFK